MSTVVSIKKNDIIYYALCLYTIAIVWANNTKIFYICTLIYCGLAVLQLLKQTKIQLNSYVFLHMLFIVFCFGCAVFGFSILPNASYNRCLIMIINLFTCYIAAILLADSDKRKRFLKFYCKMVLLFEIYLVVLSGSNIFKGRLGEFVNSPIAFNGSYNANVVSCIFIYAVIFTLDDYFKTHNNIAILQIALLLGGILLTGSRKGIVSAAIAIVVLPILEQYQQNRKIFAKVIKYLILGLIACAILMLMLFKIPTLYEIAGQRVEAMLTGVETDGSMKYREMFIDEAKMYFLQSPWCGIGIDNFKHVNFIKGYYAHNNYWEILTGSGMIGFLIYYSTYVVLCFRLWKAFKQKRGTTVPMLVYMLIMILTDYYMVSYLERLNLLLMFVAYATTLKGDNEHNENFNCYCL